MRWPKVVFALLAAMLLGGCAGLPTSSSVRAQQAISNSPVPNPPKVYPNPPQPGESPREIVGDFLRAGSSPDEDFRIARLYLTAAASNTWDPAGHPTMVTTTEQQYSVTELYGAPVRAHAKAVASLDSTGHLTELETHEGVDASFHLKKVRGQWRISSLPKDFGAWISLADFTRLYTSHVVYFADTLTHTLVPDTRWYLSSGEATALARAVLGTPPSWMQGRGHRAMPRGTRLEVDAVPINGDGVATVDLSEQALQADSATRRAIWASMMATLEALPSVRSVRLTVGGSPLAIGRTRSAVTDLDDLGYQLVQRDGSAVILRNGGQLMWADPVRRTGRPNLIKPSGDDRVKLPTLNKNWTRVAASSSGADVAAVSGDRRSLGRWVHRRLTVLTFGTHLIKPSFAPGHELWVAGHALSTTGQQPADDDGSVVWFIDTSVSAQRARPQVVSVPWLGDSTVLALRASPEGDRMAVVVRTASGRTRLMLCGVVRDKHGAPSALSTPVRQARPVSQISDVTWVDGSTLAVLGSNDPSSSRPQPILVPIGGMVTAMGKAPGADSIVGTGAGAAQVFVATSHRGVLERSGKRWEQFGSASQVIAPGA